MLPKGEMITHWRAIAALLILSLPLGIQEAHAISITGSRVADTNRNPLAAVNTNVTGYNKANPLVYAIEVLGDDQIMYASDYPHWDCMHPDSARILQERTDLSASSKRKILGDNAARFYKLPVPAGV